MKYLFGQAISYSWTPTDGDGEPVTIDSLVCAKLYSSAPTTTQMAEVTNVPASNMVEFVDSFGAATDNEYSISFSSVTDPAPFDLDFQETYFVVVNFKYDSGGETKHVQEVLYLYRPNAIGSRIDISSADVFALESKIEALKTSAWVDSHATAAKARLFRRIKGLDVKKRQIFDPEELNLAALYLTIAYCCRNLAGDGGENWFRKYEDYLQEYEEIFSATDIPIDIDDDNQPAVDEVRATGAAYLL